MNIWLDITLGYLFAKWFKNSHFREWARIYCDKSCKVGRISLDISSLSDNTWQVEVIFLQLSQSMLRQKRNTAKCRSVLDCTWHSIAPTWSLLQSHKSSWYLIFLVSLSIWVLLQAIIRWRLFHGKPCRKDSQSGTNRVVQCLLFIWKTLDSESEAIYAF